MSLMRLLSAGKSWGGGKNPEVRYTMTDPRALPKFGSPKNPFRSTAKAKLIPPAAQPLAPAPISTPDQPENFEARTAPVRRIQESKATPVLLPARSEPPDAVRAGTVRAPEARPAGTGWKQALGKLTSRLLSPRPRSVKRRALEIVEPPVQGELSLEKIKVLRNDLSDADLEVVPAKTGTPDRLLAGGGESADKMPFSAAWSENASIAVEERTAAIAGKS